MRYWPTKTPSDVRDVGLDYGPTLSKLGDPTISESVWTKLHGTASVVGSTIDPTGRKVGTRVYNGEPNSETVFRNTVTLSTGEVLTEDVFQRVRA